MLVITTDMGLCGQFNERIVEYALNLSQRESDAACRWIVVGARGWERLRDADVDLVGHLDAPGSVEAIPTAVSQAFVSLAGYLSDDRTRLLVVHNRPDDGGAFSPHHLQLAPFEPERWLRWPDGESPWHTPPMTSSEREVLLPYLVREQVFIDLFQAFIQSFAAENAARLSSMRNAADNIEELLSDLELRYRRERQDVITNELMELLGGVEAVSASQ